MSGIKVLYQKFLEKRCSPEETEELLRYFQGNENSDDILALIQAEMDNQSLDNVSHPEDEGVIARNRLTLDQRLTGKMPSKRLLSWKRWLPYAAALLLISAATLLSLRYFQQDKETVRLVSEYGDDVAPGTNRATITLADGSRHLLHGDQNGVVVGDGGILYEDGTPVITENDILHATIATPNGGQYRITLPDGTKVILNAGTWLTYPSKFLGDERLVTFVGEAYFEVAHHEHQPFRIKSRDQVIEVLGTTFNASAYNGAKSVTTLLEGRVRITTGNKKESILHPGQQAVLDKGILQVNEVAVEDYTSWIHNEFVFNDVTLSEVFAVLERWYDVKFDYPNNLVNQRIYAEINRDRKLSEVLKTLEEVVHLKFKITGRRVNVQQ